MAGDGAPVNATKDLRKMGGAKEKKDPFMDFVYIAEVNKRNNLNAGLFPNYQINPYTNKTLDFVTPKPNTRPPKLCPESIPGHGVIKESIAKRNATPQWRFCEPQTEQHRFGWFEKNQGYFDRENYDERFKFTHRTADFIRTQSMLRDYDRLMKNLGPTSQKPVDTMKLAPVQPTKSQTVQPMKSQTAQPPPQ